MKIRVLYFANLRDLFGCSEEDISLQTGATLESLAQELSRRVPDLAGQIQSLAWGVNLELAPIGTALRDGDEVALLPPVSGGLA